MAEERHKNGIKEKVFFKEKLCFWRQIKEESQLFI
jgi:ABC-type transport system involved in cytochrome c biogenesis ATPase subunit